MLVAGLLLGWLVGRSLVLSVLFAVAWVLAMTPVMIFLNRRKQNRAIERYRNILAADRAVVHVVQAQECIRFEETEDEGDLWMFQVSEDQLVVLQGQHYYESKRFPALSFELVEVADLPVMIHTQSEKIVPRETISPTGRGRLPRVEGVLVMNGSLAEPSRALELLLRGKLQFSQIPDAPS